MKRLRPLSFALLAAVAAAWTLPAYATGDCANGQTLYSKTTASVTTSCSNSSCHKSLKIVGGNQQQANNILLGALNPSLIDDRLNTQVDMAGIRDGLGLTASDIDDLATWIFYAPSCPAANPNLQASPAPVTFGSITVGATSAQTTVTITNSGSGAATGVSFSNSNATEFLVSANTCTASIGAGASCSLKVAFKPSLSGSRSGTLTVNRSGGAGLGIGMSGTGSAIATPGQLSMPGTLTFASRTVATTSAVSTVTISNVGGTAVSVSGAVSSNASEFSIVSNACTTVSAGASCTVGVTFTPSAVGARNATITVTSNGTGSPQAISVSGTGNAASSSGQLSLATTLSFASQPVATTSAASSVTVTNVGGTAVSVSSVASSNPAEFAIASNTCATVNAGATCSFGVTFTPSAAGTRSGTITLISNGTGSPQTIGASGSGTTGTPPSTVTVVEYYHAGFDHYFITSVPGDIVALDGGAFGGVWARTGYQFKAYAAPGTGTASVCRFFSTAFAPKSSHFYTPYGFECNSLKTDPGWQYEDSNLVMAMPDASGHCPAGFAPVYRFYNNFQGAAPNHRYTTDATVKAQMLAKGYTQEGPLPGLAFMCAPP